MSRMVRADGACRTFALLAATAVAACATPSDGPIVEPGGPPVAGMSMDRAAAAPDPLLESPALLAASGNAFLLVGRGPPVAALLSQGGAGAAAATSLTSGSPLATGAVLQPPPGATSPLPAAPVTGTGSLTSGSPLATGAALQPPSGATSPLAVAPVAGNGSLLGVNGQSVTLLGAAVAVRPAATVTVQTPLTPPVTTSPGAATTQLANSLVAVVANTPVPPPTTGAPPVTAPLPVTAPGVPGASTVTRLLPGLPVPIGN